MEIMRLERKSHANLFLLFLIYSLLFFISIPQNVYAKRFANEYTEFELPPGWECVLEGSEWVCQSDNEARKKEAIIILVAKLRGEQDTLDQYMAYLKQTKSYSLPGGKSQISEPKYSKVVDINEQRWVDALHLASEVPGFYTRYLATTKEDLGVAVTFSVAKDSYDAYQGVFDKVIASLRVFRQKQVKLPGYVKRDDENLFDSAALPDAGNQKENFNIDGKKGKKGGKGSGGGMDMMLILAGLAVAAGVFIFMKRKKK
ncbi:MAG: hypothetical protein HQK49_13020 [Oligoflexia bacterium]|nr:hypothetical protein [Oligoflexia bacterium]